LGSHEAERSAEPLALLGAVIAEGAAYTAVWEAALESVARKATDIDGGLKRVWPPADGGKAVVLTAPG